MIKISGIEFMEVPAGEFWMGSERYVNELPVLRVYLERFLMAREPVTEAQYYLFVKATGHTLPSHWEDGRPPRWRESHPVTRVAWRDAMAYCAWLAEKTVQAIVLPNEAQWEKAARGDQDKREYPWGDAWDETRCNNYELELGDTTPVGIFPDGASPYGCLDMAGNVWEWTRSLYSAYPYRADDGREDMTASGNRVLRGGSFRNNRDLARCAARGRREPDDWDVYYGFRLAVSP
jgi:formylglycine-generating enzyme required for sulfatase activity